MSLQLQNIQYIFFYNVKLEHLRKCLKNVDVDLMLNLTSEQWIISRTTFFFKKSLVTEWPTNQIELFYGA